MNMIEAMARVTVTGLGTREGAGLLSSLQRVELHRHSVWRCNKFNIPSEVYYQIQTRPGVQQCQAQGQVFCP